MNPNDLNLRIPITLRANNKDLPLHALLDSGAEGSFIHENLVQKYNLPVRTLPRPILVKNVAGPQNTSGQINSYA